MNLATKTMSWGLVLTAVLWTACGTESNSTRTKSRKGGAGSDTVAFQKIEEGQPDTDLEGSWAVPDKTRGKMIESEIWNIDLKTKKLRIEKKCSLDGGKISEVVSGEAEIRVNTNLLQIQRPISAKKVLGKTKESCNLDMKTNPLTYSLSQDGKAFLQLTVGNRDLEKMSRIVGQRRDSGKTDAAVEDILKKDGAASADVIKNPWIRVDKTKDLILGYYSLEFASNEITLTKYCGSEDDHGPIANAEVKVKAIITAKRIKILENKVAKSADEKCVNTVEAKEWTYSLSEDKQTLKVKNTESDLTEPYTLDIEKLLERDKAKAAESK